MTCPIWLQPAVYVKIKKIDREVVEEEGKLGEVLYWMRSGGVESKQHQVIILYCTVLYCTVLYCTGDGLVG